MPTPRSKSKKIAKGAPPPSPAAPRPFTAHLLVPSHELLSEVEGQKILRALGTGSERLPKILVNDPGLRTDPHYLKSREAREPLGGRLVRIRRPSATAGEAIAYRLLVPAVGE